MRFKSCFIYFLSVELIIIFIMFTRCDMRCEHYICSCLWYMFLLHVSTTCIHCSSYMSPLHVPTVPAACVHFICLMLLLHLSTKRVPCYCYMCQLYLSLVPSVWVPYMCPWSWYLWQPHLSLVPAVVVMIVVRGGGKQVFLDPDYQDPNIFNYNYMCLLHVSPVPLTCVTTYIPCPWDICLMFLLHVSTTYVSYSCYMCLLHVPPVHARCVH